MKKKIFILFSFFLSLQLVAYSQQKKVDSLMNVLQKDDSLRIKLNKTTYDKSDTVRVKILVNLCNELRNIGSYDKAKQYGELALDISKKIGNKVWEASSNYYIGMIYYIKRNNDEALKYFEATLKIRSDLKDKKGITDANIMMGLLLINKGKYNEAIESFKSALVIKKEINDKSGTAMAYHNIGMAYFYKGDDPIALENYLLAYKIREEINEKRGIASSLMNIGIIYDRQGNLEDARKNYTTALQYNKELGDKKAIASCYNNIGITYEKQKNYPEAIKNYAGALKIKEEIGDKKGIAVTNFNMGTIYENHHQFDSALKCYNYAFKINQEIGDEQSANRSMYLIGAVYIRLHEYDEAKKYLDKALAIAHKLGAKENIVECYGQLIVLDSLTNNWRESFTHYNQYFRYNDSMVNSDNTAKMVKSKLKYEFEKKEDSTKAEQQKKDLQLQKEMALKALQFEYEKKQANAKSEEERKQLKYEQQIKEQKLADEYSSKIALAETKQKSEAILNKALAKENTLMQQNSKNELLIRWLMIAALIGFTAFGINYYRSYKKQKIANDKILQQSEDLKMLMQEVHHRVKNNLQLISSLLELQGMRLTDDVAKLAFEEGQSRVQSIAILHHQLYQHEDLNTIELNSFVTELLRQITVVFKKQHQEIKIDNVIPETYFDIDIALPLGLMINELATNSFKYAQPTLGENKVNTLHIEINLVKENANSFTLIYKDNGVGLPKTFKIDEAKSLGLRIVTRLAKQVKGSCKYEYDNGAKFYTHFTQK